MWLWIGLYGLNINCNFLKHFLKLKKHRSFLGIHFFYYNGWPGAKLMAQKARNKGWQVAQKKSQKVKIYTFLNPKILLRIFLSTCGALIHSIWTSDEKVTDNLVIVAI